MSQTERGHKKKLISQYAPHIRLREMFDLRRDDLSNKKKEKVSLYPRSLGAHRVTTSRGQLPISGSRLHFAPLLFTRRSAPPPKGV